MESSDASDKFTCHTGAPPGIHLLCLYCALLKECNLSAFRTQWIEALGNLMCYRMAVSAMVEASTPASGMLTAFTITRAALAPIQLTSSVSTSVGNSLGMLDKPASLTPAQIDNSLLPLQASPNQ
ncbi:hypothetical protein NLI96_g12926 [Meripilus lineatus]|uniref:Uncharacterized protein n=1 Tax=Meripilus lineatus TaxID=2056292 RepID=A0AAD5UTM6_9APHY|nr:hypothetical protein NLI96_g12926 [Physisporinus lineatus]